MTTLTVPPAVRVTGVRHHFGDTVAVDGVDFDVTAGTVFGLLDPTAPARPPPCE
jgi:ABC-2 type transport system ATP-binding protein